MTGCRKQLYRHVSEEECVGVPAVLNWHEEEFSSNGYRCSYSLVDSYVTVTVDFVRK